MRPDIDQVDEEIHDHLESIKDLASISQLKTAAEELAAAASCKKYKGKKTTEVVMNVLKEFFKEGITAVKTSDIFDALIHLDRCEVRKAIRELLKGGMVYLPKEGYLQIT